MDKSFFVICRESTFKSVQAMMLSLWQDHKIIQRVIPSIAVNMMHMLVGGKSISKMFFHQVAVDQGCSSRSYRRHHGIAFSISSPFDIASHRNIKLSQMLDHGCRIASDCTRDFVRRMYRIGSFKPFTIVQLFRYARPTRRSSIDTVAMQSVSHPSWRAFKPFSNLSNRLSSICCSQPIPIVQFFNVFGHSGHYTLLAQRSQ